MQDHFGVKELLLSPPERSAFSDRHAYVCSELSSLAYLHFEENKLREQVLQLIQRLCKDAGNKVPQEIDRIFQEYPQGLFNNKDILKKVLKLGEFKLIDTFSVRGTQGFICTRVVKLISGTSKIQAFLVFRGTEPDKIEDIKTDLKFSLVKVKVREEQVEFHSGFYYAYQSVSSQIMEIIGKLKYDQLFLTGHSLGGALAMVATCILGDEVNGACYTFGAPPIGSVEIQNALKTPIYEIINHTDIVPRLPNPFLGVIANLFLGFIPFIPEFIDTFFMGGIKKALNSVSKYRHPGYKSYLTGDGYLRYNVHFLDLMNWWIKSFIKNPLFLKVSISEHGIEEYVDKLQRHALKRNL